MMIAAQITSERVVLFFFYTILNLRLFLRVKSSTASNISRRGTRYRFE